MIGIEILRAEHQNILYFVEELESYMVSIVEGKEIDIDYINHAIQFIKEYADGHHHRKEEDYLFEIMVKELGEIASKVITTGMLVEHDLNRLTVMELEAAVQSYKTEPSSKNKLDVIGHTMAYMYQIRRHIEKEDVAVFDFANRALDDESKAKVNHDIVQYNEKSDRIEDKYSKYIKIRR